LKFSARCCDSAKREAYCNSAKTFCAELLAIDSVEVPALTRIWARVRAAVSDAKSVSRMLLSEAVRFSRAICWLRIDV